MSTKSYYWSEKLSVTDTQQIYTLPRLRSVHLLNNGRYPITIEFENDIDSNSVAIPPNAAMDVNADMLDLRYKTTSGNTSELSIYGLKHEKS